MGLVLEYNALLAELAVLNEKPLGSNEAIISDSDETKLVDFTNLVISDRCYVKVQDSKLFTVKLDDPLIACIKSHVFQGDAGSYAILVSGDKIIQIEFTPNGG